MSDIEKIRRAVSLLKTTDPIGPYWLAVANAIDNLNKIPDLNKQEGQKSLNTEEFFCRSMFVR